jgi:hypothetical protein
MAEQKDSILNLAGFQSEIRCTSALQVRIAYRSPCYKHFITSQGDDWIFSTYSPGGQSNTGEKSEETNLDPYAIRRKFEAIDVDRPDIVARFLGEAGRFWPWERIRLSQIKEWREFFRWLRVDPDEAKKTPKGEKAWGAATSLKDSFFAILGLEFTRDRHTPEIWKRYGASMHFKKKASWDIEQLAALRSFALYPERAGAGSQLKLQWYDPEDWLPQQKGIPPEDWEERHKKTPKGRLEPYLRIDALNILEAIAATIYADRLHGQRFGKCKYCGRIFKIESDHGQQFCPRPVRLQSSPCKNAFLQHQRREKARKEG